MTDATPRAKLTFEPMKLNLAADFPTREAWLQVAEQEWETMRIALQFLTMDQDQLVILVQERPEAALLGIETFDKLAQQMKGQANILRCARARLAIAATGEQAAPFP